MNRWRYYLAVYSNNLFDKKLQKAEWLKNKILQGLRVAQALPNAGHKKQKNGRKKQFFFVKKIKLTQNKYFLHISSSYAKILGQKLFPTREFPRSGSKAKDGEKKKRRERLNDGDNNGQATHGARKHA